MPYSLITRAKSFFTRCEEGGAFPSWIVDTFLIDHDRFPSHLPAVHSRPRPRGQVDEGSVFGAAVSPRPPLLPAVCWWLGYRLVVDTPALPAAPPVPPPRDCMHPVPRCGETLHELRTATPPDALHHGEVPDRPQGRCLLFLAPGAVLWSLLLSVVRIRDT